MKKHFDIPQVNAIELNQTDVIMESVEVGSTDVSKYSKGISTVVTDFETWKGFNK